MTEAGFEPRTLPLESALLICLIETPGWEPAPVKSKGRGSLWGQGRQGTMTLILRAPGQGPEEECPQDGKVCCDGHFCPCTFKMTGGGARALEQLAGWKAGLGQAWAAGTLAVPPARLCSVFVTLGRFPLPSRPELPPGLRLLSLTFGISVLSGQIPSAASCPDLSPPLQAAKHGQIWASPCFQETGGCERKEGPQ